MRHYMKILNSIFYIIMRIFNYVLGIVGVIGVIAVVGGLEWDTLSFGQFFLYEFYCLCLIGLTFIVYNIRESFKLKYL